MSSQRVVVIGVGSIGERHVRCFLATGRADVSIVEYKSALAKDVAARYGVVAHCDLEAALASRPTVAVIATPAPLHIAQATRLVEAGVQVLIEKPLSISLEGVTRLQQLVAERPAVVGVAYVYRAFPVLVAMRDALQSGRFGTPRQITAVCGQHFPTYRPAYREIYYADRKAGGGAIQDALTHVINMGEWLVGPVNKLVADAAHLVLPGVEVEDTVHVLTRQGSVMGAYSLNQHQAPNETVITVICDQGTVRCEIHNNRWLWMTKPGDAWHEEPFGPSERDAAFIAQANAFLDAVEGKRPLLCPLTEGVQTLKGNLAILESAEHGTWQTINN
ncbi:MAG: ycjS 2 [Planctomycetaceae bacterium]|nr:ycjS 2 [Planctomycetaceae bacterium]